MKKSQLLLLLALLFSACDDKAIVKVKIDKPITCLKLLVFPPDEKIEQNFNTLYPFSNECPLSLFVSYKNSIVCNSNQNPSEKAKGIPSAYLRLELKEKKKLLYSYYIDLNEALSKKHLEKGFLRLKDELQLQD